MIAPQPFFEPRGTPFSVLGRLKALSELGHQVDLVTYHVGESVKIPGVTIHRTPWIPFIKRISIGPSLIKLFLDIFVCAKACSLLIRRRYDLLHSHEEASFFTIVLARLFRIRHLYDMHSSLPQQLRNFEYTRFFPLIRLFEWLEHRVVNSSNAIITICPALEQQVKQINGHVPHVMIENVATEGSPDEVSEEDVLKFRAIHSLEGKETILYTGTFEPYQGLDLLLASAARVVSKRKDVVFVLMGGRPDQVEQCRDRVRELGLFTHFRLTGMRPPEEIQRAIRASHVLVSPRVSGTNTPLKIYAYIQSGKPIVATNLSAHTQVLDSTIALLVDANPEAFAQGILAVLGDPVLAERLGRQARRLFEARFSFKTYLEKTDQALQLAVR